MSITDPDVDLLRAIADPVRLSILRQLSSSAGPVCACDFTECCTVSQPTVSHHLKVLRAAGVVTTERRGTYIYYALAPDFAQRWAGIGASLAGLVPLAQAKRHQGDTDDRTDPRAGAPALRPSGATGAGQRPARVSP